MIIWPDILFVLLVFVGLVGFGIYRLVTITVEWMRGNFADIRTRRVSGDMDRTENSGDR